MTEVREKRGLTYGIGTSLAGYDQAELLAGQSQIPNAKVKDAVDVIKAEWAKMAEQGITAEELAALDAQRQEREREARSRSVGRPRSIGDDASVLSSLECGRRRSGRVCA